MAAGASSRRSTSAEWSSAVDAHHTFARYAWELVAPDGTVAVHGVDVVEAADDGRLSRVVGFFGDLA